MKLLIDKMIIRCLNQIAITPSADSTLTARGGKNAAQPGDSSTVGHRRIMVWIRDNRISWTRFVKGFEGVFYLWRVVIGGYLIVQG